MMGGILRDKSRSPRPKIVCWFVEGKMVLQKLSRIFHLNHPGPTSNVFVFFLLVKFSGNFYKPPTYANNRGRRR